MNYHWKVDELEVVVVAQSVEEAIKKVSVYVEDANAASVSFVGLD